LRWVRQDDIDGPRIHPSMRKRFDPLFENAPAPSSAASPAVAPRPDWRRRSEAV